MTKEAKIGMLTGLGVIVVIGVLLSNYLGDPKAVGAGATTGSGSTGRMATLPVGDAYRQQVLQPVGVPPMAGPGPRTMQFANGAEIASPVNGSDRVLTPPTAFAADMTRQPTAVSPVDAGPIVADSNITSNPPMISLAEQARFPVIATDTTPRAAAQPAQMTYVIAANDSLGKISKKFYNSQKNSDIQRIVAANPGVLKDANTMLVVGKKLVIPGVAVPVTKVATTEVRQPNPVTIYLPGDVGKTTTPADSARKVQPPAKTATYVVQAGDTIEKIARKIAPSKVSETRQKLIALNALKDPNNLQVGAKLKVPA